MHASASCKRVGPPGRMVPANLVASTGVTAAGVADDLPTPPSHQACAASVGPPPLREADLSSAHTAKDLLQGEHNELRESHVSLTKKAKALDAMVVHMKNQIQRNETHVDHLKQLYNLYPSAKKL